MRIEVVIGDWEQACCGEPFRTGEEATWKVFAADPATIPEGAPPVFHEEHHGQTPHNVPHWEVKGKVASIAGISYLSIPIPGKARGFTTDRSKPSAHRLESVDGPEVFDVNKEYADVASDDANRMEFSEYRVALDVPDDARLPGYVRNGKTR